MWINAVITGALMFGLTTAVAERSARACSCIVLSAAGYFRDADLVFFGRAAKRVRHGRPPNEIWELPITVLHPLKGNRKGQYAIAINDQWRICFKFFNGDAYDIEI